MVAPLIDRLLTRGVKLRIDGDRLVVRARAGALTPQLQDEIRENKEEIIALLREASSSQPGSPISGSMAHLDDDGPWVLSTAQERFWVLETLRPGEGVYNLPGAFRLEGPLVPDALERALNAFVLRHGILNVRFAARAGVPSMYPEPARPLALERVSLLEVPEETQDEELRRLLEDWAEEPMDLERGPLFHARLVALGPDHHVLFVLSHAAVWDGWSFDVLLEDLASLYPSFLPRAEPAVLPEPQIQYKDYAGWQRKRLAGGDLDRQMKYWRTRLEPPRPVVSLPTDHPRPARSFAGARLNFRFDRTLLERLARTAREEEATVFMILLAAFVALLHRETGQDDLVVLTPMRGREAPELEGLVGCFANMLATRTHVDPTWTFRQLLRRVREQCLDDYENGQAPFDVLARELDGVPGQGADSLFRATFTYQNTVERRRTIGDLRVRPVARDHRRCYSEVSLWVREHPEQLDGALDYRTDLFERSSMERLLAHFRTILQSVARSPDVALADLLVRPGAEEGRARVDDLNQEEAARAVGDAVAAWSARDPERVALESGGTAMTFRELGARIDAVARLHRREGKDASGATVLVDPSRGVDAVVDALAALGAGVAVRMWSASGEHDPGVDASGGSTSALRPDEVAGLLGRVADLVGLDENDEVLVSGPLSRSSAMLAVLLALGRGARAVLASDRAGDDEWELADALEPSEATILTVPTHLCGRLLATDWPGDRALRVLCLGGPPTPEVADELRRRTGGAWWLDGHPDVGPWLLYGPVTTEEVRAGRAHCFLHVDPRIVDARGREMLEGVPGELVFEVRDGDVGTVRTGEVARMVGPRTIQRLGRRDRKVVIDGVLVDPSETERVLSEDPMIADVAVCARATGGGPMLVAYIVWKGRFEAMTSTEVRALVRSRLPDAFAPRMAVTVDAVARATDGTPDSAALPDPFLSEAADAPAHVSPRTPEEVAVAGVWSELLRVERVGIHDNFYELGGNSLMLTRAAELIEARTGRRLDPRVLFFHSLEGVARALEVEPQKAPEASAS